MTAFVSESDNSKLSRSLVIISVLFSERELTLTFAICHRPSVCRTTVCLSVGRLSVTFVHPTQAIEIFGNVSTPFGTLAISDLSVKIFTEIVSGEPLRRGS